MGVPKTVIDFLAAAGASYDLAHHPHTGTTRETVAAAHVAPGRFAKAVLMYDDEGYFLAVVPASRRLNLKLLTEAFGRRPQLATEQELPRVFSDCATGAVPALGAAYGVDCIVDSALRSQPEVFIEAGDHDEIIRLEGPTFVRLMAGARWGEISEA